MQIIWNVMLYSQHFTFHPDFPLEATSLTSLARNNKYKKTKQTNKQKKNEESLKRKLRYVISSEDWNTRVMENKQNRNF